MHALVDATLCVGCGLCPDICPEVFEMDGDIAVVKADPVPAEVEADCQEAASSCPVGAIAIR